MSHRGRGLRVPAPALRLRRFGLSNSPVPYTVGERACAGWADVDDALVRAHPVAWVLIPLACILRGVGGRCPPRIHSP
jgi:hypothetical protein